MVDPAAPAYHRTHEVVNQPPPFEHQNLFTLDLPLQEALAREGAGWAREQAVVLGALLNQAPVLWAREANELPPRLRTHDRYGHRLDLVEYHPSWHELLRLGVSSGLHAMPWREERPGAHVARATLFYLLMQVDSGVGCPLSMTCSAVPALRTQPELARLWEPRLGSLEYDPRFLPAGQKRGALCGMAMTEKQGGSDVRANQTWAVPLGKPGPGRDYELTGHKWFCSAPMSDVFLVLAQAPRGLSCFLLPRFLPDGEKNRFFLQRLKDKLGNRSNASSELELDGAWAQLVGEEGRGVPTLLEMVNHTRLDCVIGSASMMRQALTQALHHCSHRQAFGKRLIDQPLMRNVLADLSIESEAATLLMMRLAAAYDRRADPAQRRFARIATAVGKYWVCKRATAVVAEALECLGGNGYVEESLLPRLYRDIPLNAIWEGSSNVICLDVLRALGHDPACAEAFLAEVFLAKGRDSRLDAYLARLEEAMFQPEDLEPRARRLVEQMALGLQGALLVRYGDPKVAEAFLASRLTGDHGLALGTLPAGLDFGALLGRAFPHSS